MSDKRHHVLVHEGTHVNFAIVSGDDLEVVVGGGWAGDAWNWAKGAVGNFFGGLNIGIANGNNNRVAVGNQGPTTLGDNSPINK